MYKVGDHVRIKSKEWYLANRDNGISKWVSFSDGSIFGLAKSTYCGQIMTIKEISEDGEYILEEDNTKMHWSEESFEGLVIMDRFIKAEDIYNKEYSTGEYCHEQSFKWGFQEGYEYALNKVYKYIEEHIFDFPWYDSESELSSTDIVEEIHNVMKK